MDFVNAGLVSNESCRMGAIYGFSQALLERHRKRLRIQSPVEFEREAGVA
jgi:hypothetical protein